MKEKLSTLCELLLQFLKFGCFTFGGGLSILAQMQQVYADEKKVITYEELLDMIGVARSVPGMMIGNVAMLFGYRQAGVAGGLVCLAGMSLPPMIVIALLTTLYEAFRDSLWVSAAMNGVRAAVAPIFLCAVLKLMKSAFSFKPCYLVSLLTFVLYFFFHVNCVWLIIIGAVFGLTISSLYEKGEAK